MHQSNYQANTFSNKLWIWVPRLHKYAWQPRTCKYVNIATAYRFGLSLWSTNLPINLHLSSNSLFRQHPIWSRNRQSTVISGICCVTCGPLFTQSNEPKQQICVLYQDRVSVVITYTSSVSKINATFPTYTLSNALLSENYRRVILWNYALRRIK